MNEMQIFNNPEFGIIRTAIINGKDYFCGNDVATALCYSSPKNAITRHCKGALYWCPQGEQNEMKYISEGDMYRLIVKASTQSNSKDVKDKAERFEKWIFDEVLPALRKTGTYDLEKNPLKLLEVHYEAIKQVNQKVETLEDRFNKLEADMPVFTIDAKNIQNAVRKKGMEVLGGKSSNAYKDKSTRTYVYADIQCMLRRNFGVRRYEEIRHKQADVAIGLVREYKPPVILQEKVDMVNSQMNLEL